MTDDVKGELEVQVALGTALDKVSYRTFVDEYLPTRDWADKSFETSCEDGWYDWFCKDASLVVRLKKMVPMIKRVMKSSKINPDKTYIFFKNNCPLMGKTYDDFRICDIFTGDVLFCITPSNGHSTTMGQSSVWGKENEFKSALVEGSVQDIYNFFGV